MKMLAPGREGRSAFRDAFREAGKEVGQGNDAEPESGYRWNVAGFALRDAQKEPNGG